MKKVLAVLLVLCFVLAGCSNGVKPADEPAEKDTFVVGMEVDSAPFNFQLATATDTSVAIEGGYADGYDVMMSKAIADKLGKTLVIKKIAWDGLIPALVNGDIDAIIGDMTATEEREKSVDFTTPYYDPKGEVIVVLKGSGLESLDDIQQFAGKRLVGQLNTINDEAIDQIEGVVHSTPLATYPLMVLALTNGDVDGIVCQTAEAKSMMMSNPDLVMVTFSTEKGFDIDTTVSIALQEGTRGGEFFNAVQTALDSISDETRENWMVDAISKAPVEE
ncbi:MAG: transporter substrate-binding domain-containing protein [Erysipelotrichaceae bacterium]|nr:transporter substrate-binding domain-containing protein [Erysipelotrichaceae bacterium]